MEKKNIDWSNLGFGYIKTDKRYVANFKDGKWDEGGIIEDDMIVMSECAGVLQYAQTVFEGMKAYTTEDGHIVTFRPDLNADRMMDSAKRLEMPVFPKETCYSAVGACCGTFSGTGNSLARFHGTADHVGSGCALFQSFG